MPHFLDNHDMDRFLFIAEGDREALRRAAEAQLSLPGPAVIYYGTEVALEQRVSTRNRGGLDNNRVPMAWGRAQDDGVYAFYRELIARRKAGA